MIISHKNKFIFLKSKKTAGTSIEIALSEFCGEEDIITPFKGDISSETLRTKLGFRGPQNYIYPNLKSSKKAWVTYVYHRLREKKIKSINLFWDHLPAIVVRRYVGENIWNSYFKFSFERNPFDKVISFYYWATRGEGKSRISLSEFIQSRSELGSSFHIYGNDNSILADHVGIFENLNSELEYISEKIGKTINIDSIKAKSKINTNDRNYKDLLSEKDKEKIALIHSREIAHFGFKY